MQYLFGRNRVATVFLISLLAITEGAVAQNPSAPGRQMPELRNRRLVMARQVARLSELRLHLGVFYIASENWREDLEPNRVYMQTPQATATVSLDTPIACWTFEKAPPGAKLVASPKLIGMTAAAAEKTIDEAGLRLAECLDDLDRSSDGGHPLMYVLEQYPRPGQTVFAGTSVFLRFANLPQESAATETNHSISPAASAGGTTGPPRTSRLSPSLSWTAAIVGGLVMSLGAVWMTTFVRRRRRGCDRFSRRAVNAGKQRPPESRSRKENV